MAIYMLQTIKVGTQLVNLFFDSGCGDMTCRKGSVDKLQGLKDSNGKDRTENVLPGPLVLTGVGDL